MRSGSARYLFRSSVRASARSQAAANSSQHSDSASRQCAEQQHEARAQQPRYCWGEVGRVHHEQSALQIAQQEFKRRGIKLDEFFNRVVVRLNNEKPQAVSIRQASSAERFEQSNIFVSARKSFLLFDAYYGFAGHGE